MLSPPDAALCQREPDIPGLAALLDPDRATALIQPLFSTPVQQCRLVYLRYKPGANCLASYRVRLAAKEVWVYAIAHGPDATQKLGKAHRHLQENGQGGMGRVDETTRIALYRFPFDRRLKELAALLGSDERRQAFLQRLLPDHPQLWQAEIAPLHYKPERRFVARLEGDNCRALIKLYTPTEYAQASVASVAFRPTAALHLPRRCGKSSRRQALAWEWAPGRSLVDVLGVEPAGTWALVRTGEALAGLHSQRPRKLATTSNAPAALNAAAAAITALTPSQGGRARRLAERILALLAHAEEDRTPLHGDFSADQVLLPMSNAWVTLLDLDQAAWGEPAEDLAGFVAELIQRRLNSLPGAADETEALHALLAGYSRRRQPPSPNRIHLYTAVHLLRRAPEAFRLRLCADWPGQIEQILTLAEQEVFHAQSTVA